MLGVGEATVRRDTAASNGAPSGKKAAKTNGTGKPAAPNGAPSKPIPDVGDEIRVRAEKRAGELLAGMDKSKGGRPTKNSSRTTSSFRDALNASGITEDQSSKWRTAAMVYAWTEPEQGKRTDLAQKGAKLSLSEFAALNIRGLSKRDTVAKYRKAMRLPETAPKSPGNGRDYPTPGHRPLSSK